MKYNLIWHHFFSENHTKLIQLEEAAIAGKKGKWGPQETMSEHVRDIKWNLDNARQFADLHKNKEIEGLHLF